MRRWTKASSGGPFQHSLQALLFRTVSLAGGHGQRREKGQEKAINTLWNWCGSRKFRRRGEGKQRRIMYLLTALCSAWEKDDKNKMFFQFLSDIEFFFLLPFGHKPLAARFSVCLLVYLFVGDKYFCLMRHTSVLQHNKKKKKSKEMTCRQMKDAGEYGFSRCPSNYRPGTEECQSDRQAVQGLCRSLTSSFPSLNLSISLKSGTTIRYFIKWQAVS